MALATADNNGIPNVVAIASKIVFDDNTVITIDTFHEKTIRNIKKNPMFPLPYGKILWVIK